MTNKRSSCCLIFQLKLTFTLSEWKPPNGGATFAMTLPLNSFINDQGVLPTHALVALYAGVLLKPFLAKLQRWYWWECMPYWFAYPIFFLLQRKTTLYNRSKASEARESPSCSPSRKGCTAALHTCLRWNTTGFLPEAAVGIIPLCEGLITWRLWSYNSKLHRKGSMATRKLPSVRVGQSILQFSADFSAVPLSALDLTRSCPFQGCC